MFVLSHDCQQGLKDKSSQNRAWKSRQTDMQMNML